MTPMTPAESLRLERLELRVQALSDAMDGLAARLPRQGNLTRFLTQQWVLAMLITGTVGFVGFGVKTWTQATRDHEMVARHEEMLDRTSGNLERILGSTESFCAAASILWAKHGETIQCTRTVLAPLNASRDRRDDSR